jgi:hypothetical protein
MGAQIRTPETIARSREQQRIAGRNRTPEQKALAAARARELKLQRQIKALNFLPRAEALKIIAEKTVVVKQDAEKSDGKYSLC